MFIDWNSRKSGCPFLEVLKKRKNQDYPNKIVMVGRYASD